MKFAEQLLGNGIVGAFAVPAGPTSATRIAATDVDREGDIGKSRDDCVVGIDRASHIFARVLAARTHAFEQRRIDVGGVTRFVDLDVSTAGSHDLSDHAPFNVDHVSQKSLYIRIDL